MSTIQQVGFLTRYDTGANVQGGVGNDLAKFLTSTSKEVTNIVKTHNLEEEKERLRQERLASKTEKEIEEMDFLENLNYKSALSKMMKEKNFNKLTADVQEQVYKEFNEEYGEPMFIQDKYIKNFEIDHNTRMIGINDLKQKEFVQNVVPSTSKKLAATMFQANEMEVEDSIKQMKNLDKNYKGETFYNEMVSEVINELTRNKDEYNEMSADELENSFSGLKVIKNEKIKKPFRDFINTKRITELADSDNYADGNSIMQVAKKTGIPAISIAESVEKINKERVPMLLQTGNYDRAAKLYEHYGMDSKPFEEHLNKMLMKGDFSFYDKTKDRVAYSTGIIQKMNGLQFLYNQAGGSMTWEQVYKWQSDISGREVGKIDYKDFNKEIEDDIGRGNYYQKYIQQAMKLTGSYDGAIELLEKSYNEEQVGGVQFKNVGIKNEKDLNEVKKYMYQDIGDNDVVNIEPIYNGYMVRTPNGEKYLPEEQMKQTVKNAKNYNNAVSAVDIAFGGSEFGIKYMSNETIVKDAEVLKKRFNDTVKAIEEEFGFKIDSKDRKALEVYANNKMKKRIDNAISAEEPNIFSRQINKLSKIVSEVIDDVQKRDYFNIDFFGDKPKTKEGSEYLKKKKAKFEDNKTNLLPKIAEGFTEFKDYKDFANSDTGRIYDNGTGTWEWYWKDGDGTIKSTANMSN